MPAKIINSEIAETIRRVLFDFSLSFTIEAIPCANEKTNTKGQINQVQ